MSVIKINAITVPTDSGDELGRRFAARAGAVDGQPGFEGFELLQPTDGRNTWLVITRWADEESFETWAGSQEFSKAHRGAETAGAASQGQGQGQGHGQGQAAGHGQSGGAGTRHPVGMSAELWSFRVSTASSADGKGG